VTRPQRRARLAAAASGLALLAAVAGLAGCSDDRDPSGTDAASANGAGATTGHTGATPGTTPKPLPRPRDEPRRQKLIRARCPASAPPGCRSASGTIVYVERVDPDGDGDAHFVLLSRESITGPGLTVVDVRRDLRPHPLPGPGDRISAAGPVYHGSYGQRQIEAIELRLTR
jgi:hypothetical protein